MRSLIFLILFTISSIAFAQQRVKGIVVDNGGQPLSSVIVKAKDKALGKMKGYTKSDANGRFSIDMPANSYLEFSMLGFAKLKIEKFDGAKELRVEMREEAIALKEVKVKADKVRMKGDTISYNIGTYADGKDRSIGDVLARIPGFEVKKETGKITYEGRDISNLYIEGLDMLGDKYGVATNTLPQVDVGSVEVMRHHQPVKVLDDFTYSDETAVNIKMKESAKSRWVTSMNVGTGWSDDEPLWKLEGFGLRLKQKLQTMITYKTNNTGENISNETSSLFSISDLDDINSDYISLAKPSTSLLNEQRTLFNRSHSLTLNTLKKLTDSSQLNLQVIYNNDRETAHGDKETTYYLADGNRKISNRKDYKSKENNLYALLKYEKNSTRNYLKNTLTGDFSWRKEWLNEAGTNPNRQYAKTPDVDITDNLYVVRRFGNSLISFYSDNKFTSKSPSLAVDHIHQDVAQRHFTTNTYAMGGTMIRRFTLSLKAGVKANVNRLETEAIGLPDSLGTLSGTSKFWSAKVYLDPTLLYKVSDFNLSISPTLEYVYDKYSLDNGKSRMLFSPSANLRWNITSEWKLSLGGDLSTEPLDPSRFYNTIILQDFQYINEGYGGYSHATSKTVRGGLAYGNAMRALHASLNVSRSFSTYPYTETRRFVGDYIILSAAEQETKGNSWMGRLSLSKGINLWRGILNASAIYMNDKSTIVQDAVPMDYESQKLSLRAGFDFSFWQGMHIKYNLNYTRSRMEIAAISTTSDIDNWRHTLSLAMPIKDFTIKIDNEYYQNELADGSRKNFLLTDASLSYKLKHLDITLSLRNLFNHDTFDYVVNSELTSTSYSNYIRPREVLLSFYYSY